jgi:predicted molibdopterin-dependent oxidoreductase YjgC
VSNKSLFEIPSSSEAEQITIKFDGQALRVPAGINVAAALLARGVRDFRATPVSRSSRAPFCMMGVCFECLVEIDGVPARQSCLIPVRDGMEIRRQEGAIELKDDEMGEQR